MGYLTKENHALIEKLEGIKEILKDKNFEARKRELIPKVNELMDFKDHYLKKENISFHSFKRLNKKMSRKA